MFCNQAECFAEQLHRLKEQTGEKSIDEQLQWQPPKK